MIDVDIACYNPGDRQRQYLEIAEMQLTLCSIIFLHLLLPLKTVNKQY